jgi:biopolymer transport protein ExbD
MRFRNEPQKNSNFIDIAPFVDTVFNLLIFFALSLNFISTPGIQVNLPESGSQEIARKERDLRVVVTPTNQVYLNDKPIDMKGLGSRFREEAKSHKLTQVLIEADERVFHGTVVQIMDLARTEGLHRLAIITRPKKER